MSTLQYAAVTNFRDLSAPGTSTKDTADSPGVKTYSDALAALVPAEMLSVHALIISQTQGVDAHRLLWWAFWAMCALCTLIYVFPRATGGRWDKFDIVRMFIPAAAFFGWAMLQPKSAFDAVADWSAATRSVAAILLAIVLGLLATALAYKADEKPKA